MAEVKSFALLIYLLVWWQVVVAFQPVLYALDDWAMGRRAVAMVVAMEWRR